MEVVVVVETMPYKVILVEDNCSGPSFVYVNNT